MLRTNADRLVKISVWGEVISPVFISETSPYRISYDGRVVALPGMGGITYNVRVGDLATGWEADHVEPGVSLENKEKDEKAPAGYNMALNLLACVGNEAKVVSGDAKGERGVVTGKHGGINHVMVDFSEETLEKLVLKDKVQIKAWGMGLKLLDLPAVKVMNLDPGFMQAINPTIENGKLVVPVTHTVPAATMGSGLGVDQVYSGDYDIQLFDKEMVKQYGLEDLRLGDLVAILDADHSYGRIYKKGAVSVGIVVHTDCVISGHGPGVTSLFTSSEGMITPKLDEKANIATLLKLRR
jgi:hypothetical protein